jgi:hypothetical protein
LKNI